MKFYLILLSIFLSLFRLTDLSLTITYGDIISFSLLLFFLKDLGEKKCEINLFSQSWFFYILLLFFSATLNLTLFEGRYLNIFKTNIFSLIYFIMVYSLFLRNKLRAQNFIIGLAVLATLFLVKTWPEMQKAWASADQQFTSLDVFESSLNLNTWGFVLILFLLMALYAFVKFSYKKIAIASTVILIFFIFFSYSRTAYVLSAFILFLVLFFIHKGNLKNFILPVGIMVILFYLENRFNFLNLFAPEAAQTFLNKKANNFENDLVETRFYTINVKPILEKFNSFNPIQMILGDGVSIQHSFVSHTLVVTGILGFIVFLRRFFFAARQGWRQIKLKRKVTEAKFLILIVAVVLINDFITNLSSFLPFAAYLSSIILAYFFAEIDLKKDAEKLNISN